MANVDIMLILQQYVKHKKEEEARRETERWEREETERQEALRKRLEDTKGIGEEKTDTAPRFVHIVKYTLLSLRVTTERFTGSEHAQRDAEQADKINSDSLKDTKPPSPQFKRGLTASERRSLEAEKRAALRQQRMRELEEDAMKAQVVIAQVKAMSASSLETLAISPPDADRKSSASDNELHDGGLGRRSSGSSTKST
ncbi:hypothetical protein OS493_029494 [Desmophyllum pertusum]|uniref:Uncharacterized protein n=1 Tax=Desmophyllum pertusum TaxID=174260 RepID=A0A9W9Y8V4_9CNID|nr:hypothetical protein OS493_029494 [Desmophyllum pertusum]